MFSLEEATIPGIHREYAEGRLTVRELVLSYMMRIAKLDSCNDGLNSVLELNPDALFIADAFDDRLRNGEPPTRLFGIPILIKANINTHDRMRTTAGSLALADHFAPYDAHIIKLLRQAGAIIAGKTNMTEFANYMTREGMPSGYSSLGGQVINPYNRKKTPSGSSSGSAVAVAANLCTVSIGTETSGSIMHPAWCNGLVGVKPTLGLMSRSGIVPICSTHDTPGPMARTVRDAAILLGAMTGSDEADQATLAQGGEASVDYTRFLDSGALRGMRIGLNMLYCNEEEEDAPDEAEKAAFDHLCEVLRGAGAELIPGVQMARFGAIANIMKHEFKRCMNAYLSTVRGSTAMRDLQDIIDFNQLHASAALRYGQSLLLDCNNHTTGALTEPVYWEAMERRENAILKMDAQFEAHGVDVVLCGTFTNAAPFAGFPSATIPIGQREDGIPLGSYWIARRYDEATLLRAVYAAEQALALSLHPNFE